MASRKELAAHKWKTGIPGLGISQGPCVGLASMLEMVRALFGYCYKDMRLSVLQKIEPEEMLEEGCEVIEVMVKKRRMKVKDSAERGQGNRNNENRNQQR